MHKDAQHALSMGATRYSIETQVRLERELCRACDIDVFDEEVIDRMLDRIHDMAFPGPVAPPRLELAGGWDPRE